MDGKQILSLVLITNEAIDFALNGSLVRFACNLKYCKSYNHVNWEFLILLLEKIVFKWKRID